MSEVVEHCRKVRASLPEGVRLVAVSKTHPVSMLREVYDMGIRDFGENKVQELLTKVDSLPTDVHWHMIGHLQTNKVRAIAPFVHLVHSVDSVKLLECLAKEGRRAGRRIDCLLQIHVAAEAEKFGFLPAELCGVLSSVDFAALEGVRVRGLMAVATNTSDAAEVEREFATVEVLYNTLRTSGRPGLEAVDTLCMGMSHDYTLALRHGANMVRIGTSIFGERDYSANK